jgi:starch phosphorylase
LLEQEIVPLFYARTNDGLPRGWLKMMKRTISTICPVFNTNRMVQEYVEKCYWPSAQRFAGLTADHLKKAHDLAVWRRRLQDGWQQVRIEHVETNGADPMHVGAELGVRAKVNLGSLRPDEVNVQLFHGVVDTLGEIPQPRTASMSHNGAHDGPTWLFQGAIPCRASGQYGFSVRVLPKHPDLDNPFEPGLVCWG